MSRYCDREIGPIFALKIMQEYGNLNSRYALQWLYNKIQWNPDLPQIPERNPTDKKLDSLENSALPAHHFARERPADWTCRMARISESFRRVVAKLKQRHLKGYFVKNLLFKASLVAGAVLVSIAGQAQQSAAGQAQQSTKAAPKSEAFQALCRVKAKESANLAFKSCMSENKSAEIESIRKGYQERLEQIKAQYEEELGKVSGKQKASSAKSESKRPGKIDESQLMKNAILEDATDEIQESSHLMEQKDSDETESGRFIDKSGPDKKENLRDTQLPKAPAYFESASRNDTDKREPKEPQFPPKSKRNTISFKNQIAAATKTKAILFNDMTDAPEPIPVEAMNQPLGHNN